MHRGMWVMVFATVLLVSSTVRAEDAEELEAEAGEEIEDLCERLPCVEAPTPFSPATIGMQLGAGALAAGVSIGVGHGLYKLSDRTAWMSLAPFLAAPLSAGWVVPMEIGESRGGDGASGAFVGGAAGITAGVWYGVRKQAPNSTVFMLWVTTAALFGGVLGFHIDDSLQALFGDRPTMRLASLSPSITPSEHGPRVLMGWSGQF